MHVEIDDELHERLDTRATSKGFGSTDDYVEFVLETVLEELEDGQDDSAVTERLEDLGYLN